MKVKKNDTVLVITGKDAGKKAKVLVAECESAGEEATFFQHQNKNLAIAEADTAFQNVVKILGGFAALEDPREGAAALLAKYSTNGKLSKLNEQIRDLDGEVAFYNAVAKELAADETVKNAAAKIAKAEKKAAAFAAKKEKLLPHVEALKAIVKEDDAKIANANDLLEVVRGHKVTFISGHTHINNVLQYESNISEHNVAAICGSWWDTDHCTDGTPSGYKVFTKQDGKLSWYYKSVGHDKNHQVEVYKPGQTSMHPNSVVLNVWDWDPSWKVEWFEDGKPMGKLKPVHEYSPVYVHEINAAFADKKIPSYKRPKINYHYFAATPSQYAKHVTVSVENPFGKSWVYDVDMSEYVDVQAHRGGAGLMPENTIEAMKHALDMGVNTLELDLQVSKDGLVVVSHDPYFHHRYAIRPDGSYVEKDDPKEYIYTMPYSEVAKYDVGSRESEVWPGKACIKTVKPLANDLIDFVENYTKENGLSPVRYNIEIKSKDAAGEGQNWPTYDRFVTECCKFLHSKQLDDRLVVQSFDVRALNYMHEKYPEFILSYLVDADAPDFDTYMSYLKFTPQWLSPHHTITDEALVQKCREKGIKLVPWTVDKPEDIKRILDLGVEAIISNYPDRVLMQTRGYVFPTK